MHMNMQMDMDGSDCKCQHYRSLQNHCFIIILVKNICRKFSGIIIFVVAVIVAHQPPSSLTTVHGSHVRRGSPSHRRRGSPGLAGRPDAAVQRQRAAAIRGGAAAGAGGGQAPPSTPCDGDSFECTGGRDQEDVTCPPCPRHNVPLTAPPPMSTAPSWNFFFWE